MRREIRSAVQTAVELGLTRKWVNEFLPGEFTLPQSLIKKESQAVQNKLRPLSFQHIIGTVLFYAVVILLACFVFMIENMKHKPEKSPQQMNLTKGVDIEDITYEHGPSSPRH